MQTHPDIWKVITQLKKEEHLSTTKKLQNEREDRERKRRKYVTIDDRLKEAISKYNTENKMMFLKAVV